MEWHHSRDYLKSAFFGAAFGWKAYSMADSDEFRYAQALLSGRYRRANGC